MSGKAGFGGREVKVPEDYAIGKVGRFLPSFIFPKQLLPNHRCASIFHFSQSFNELHAFVNARSQFSMYLCQSL